MEEEHLEEYLILPSTSRETERSFIWTYSTTLVLIDLYKKLREQVGTMKVRNLKKMWQEIALEFSTNYNLNTTPANCENRWRVLERNYKKYVDNKNQTGAGRNHFEYADAMEDVLGKKKSIRPTIILTSNTKAEIPQAASAANTELQVCSVAEATASMPPPEGTASTDVPRTVTPRCRPNRVREKTGTDILLQMKMDKMLRHSEKLTFEKEKFEKKLILENKKISLKEKKNELLEKQNKLQQDTNRLLYDILNKK